MSRIKIAIACVVMLLVGWSGYSLYCYFLDLTYPVVELQGVEDGGCYAGDVQCILSGSDGYKVSNVSIWVDQKPAISRHLINKKEFEYSFPIATKALADGKHALKIEIQDGSFRKNTTIKELQFVVDNVPLRIAFVRPDTVHKVFQGRTLHIQFQSNKTLKEAYVEALAHRYPCVREAENSPVYECFVPILSDENPNEHLFTVHATDSVGTQATLSNKFQVVMYPFKKQLIGSRAKITETETDRGERALNEDLQKATQASPCKKMWKSSFFVPCDMTGISTPFGTLRTTQERGKYRHDAVDFVAAPKSIAWACQDGVIVIKGSYIHSGNTVVIDHGCGILSLYFHLESFADIAVGDAIKKGKPVGRIGHTGYATGDHLHWELRINNISVDPMQWTTYDF